MRYRILVLALLAGACTRADETPAVDTAAPATAAPASISLADVAGTWNATATPEGTDSAVVSYQIKASADPAAWTMTLPGRDEMPIRVATDADSIMISNGPYESVLRKGVMVATESVVRMVDGRLVGTAIARYSGVTTADSVVRLRIEATRTP